MGRLDPFTDITGKMSQSQVNAQQLSQIIEELNRNGDQLDAITNNLAIVSSGKATITTPVGFTDSLVSANHGLGFAPAVLAFFTIDGAPPSYQVFNAFVNSSGSFLYYVAYQSFTDHILFEIHGTPGVHQFDFSYYLLQQPANLTNASIT